MNEGNEITDMYDNTKSAERDESLRTVPRMIPYNTGMPRLAMPEYGRNIQNMVDRCVAIEDEEERTRTAKSIIGVMARLFPSQVGKNGDMRKLWDHLNIISHFQLNIDFPVEVVDAEELLVRPHKIPYGEKGLYHRQYGRFIPHMIEIVADMPEGEEKDALISMLAHQMKKQLQSQNKEGMVSNLRVLKDLNYFSGGRIDIDPDNYMLRDYYEIEMPFPTKGKKKKRK